MRNRAYHDLGGHVDLGPGVSVRDCEAHSRGLWDGPEGPEKVGSIARLSLVAAHAQHVKEEAQFTGQAKLSRAEVRHQRAPHRGQVIQHLSAGQGTIKKIRQTFMSNIHTHSHT